MTHRYRRRIPKTPLFKRNMYDVPEEYSKVYEHAKIIDDDQQKALFYVTQFGGFRLKRIPSYFLSSGNEKFFEKWFKMKHENGFFSFKANPDFISRLGEVKLQPILRKKYTSKSHPDDILRISGFTRSQVQEIEEFLARLNEVYSNVRLNITIPNSGTTHEDKIDLSTFNAIPHLQFRPMAGGRFFQSGPGGSYQRISSNLRPFLTINENPVTEIDLTAATLQFTSIILQRIFKHSLLKDEFLLDDPYNYFLSKLNSTEFKTRYQEGRDLSRDNLKSILYTLIYSPSNTQRSNVNHRLTRMGVNYRHSDLENEFSEFFSSIAKIKSLQSSESIAFPAHITIFREESRFAAQILKRSCLDERLIVLPIHDSFITTRKNRPKLERIISSVSQEYYGRVLPYKVKY